MPGLVPIAADTELNKTNFCVALPCPPVSLGTPSEDKEQLVTGGRVFGSGSVAAWMPDLELDILSLRVFACKIERLSNISGKSGAGWHMRCPNEP